MLASSYPLMDVMWTMFAFFAWVLWISIVIMTLADNFRRPDLSGAAKAGWLLLIVFVPLIGVLAYTATRPHGLKATA
jgi:phospholipase D-like protein